MAAGILDVRVKEVQEKKRWHFTYVDWLADQGGGTISGTPTVVSSAPADLIISGISVADGIVSYFCEGGTANTDYLVTCTVTTTAGAVEEGNIKVKVKDSTL